MKEFVARVGGILEAVAEVVENSSGENSSDLDKTGRHPSGVNQIGRNLLMSLAGATYKSNVVDSICMDHPDVLVV